MKELQKVLDFLSSLLSHHFQSPRIKRLVGRRKDGNLERLDCETKGGKEMKFTSRKVTAKSSSSEDLTSAVAAVTASFGKSWSMRIKHICSSKDKYIINAISRDQSEWIEIIVEGSDSE